MGRRANRGVAGAMRAREAVIGLLLVVLLWAEASIAAREFQETILDNPNGPVRSLFFFVFCFVFLVGVFYVVVCLPFCCCPGRKLAIV